MVLQAGRGLGITEELRGLFESGWTVVFAVFTQLGDVWFFFLIAGGFYWLSFRPDSRFDRRYGAFVLALPIVYLVVIQALKGLFELPRPTGAGSVATMAWLPTLLVPVFENAATADGYGFPSGHALGTTLVWGGWALAIDSRSRRLRFAIATVVVGLVSISRLALGVHYAVDVIAGIVIGAVLLYALYRLSDRATEPGRAFLIGVAIGIIGLFNRVTFDSAAAFGIAVGAWFAWRLFADRQLPTARTRSTAVLSVVLLALAGVFLLVVYASVPPAPVTALTSAIAAAVIVGTPAVSARLLTAVRRPR
jgi:membrane-associated phospholipid phosphatase